MHRTVAVSECPSGGGGRRAAVDRGCRGFVERRRLGLVGAELTGITPA